MTPPARPLDRLSPAHRALADSAAAIAAADGLRLAIVGGAVRDLLLGLPVRQLDLMAGDDRPGSRDLPPGITLARAFARVHSGGVNEHPRFGTAVVTLPGGETLDFASAREETYPAPGALPDVRPAPFEKDLERRDFTVNTLAIPLEGAGGAGAGTILSAGNALEDLEARLLRVLHPASFRDDPTRLFRGARFAARLGFAFEEETSRLFREAVSPDEAGRSFVDLVSPARLRHEVELFLAEQGPAGTARALEGAALLGAIHRELSLDAARRRLFTSLENSPGEVAPPGSPLVLLLAALTIDISPLATPEGSGEPAAGDDLPARVGARLGLDGPSARRLRRTGPEVAGLLHAAGSAGTPEGFLELCASWAGACAESRALARAMLSGAGPFDRAIEALRDRRPGLTGEDLLTLGLPQGPAIGRVLAKLSRERLSGAISTPEQERLLAERLVAGELDSAGGAGKTRER